ncbi:hypothetical protein [Actinoplanes regularis]|uniref:hypothetical protein n=1 Tax=Actinoplanes regularis TaxID=52697 RepID=UPI002555B99D|nr:hypothetical protein [Actinoplanes regularis]
MPARNDLGLTDGLPAAQAKLAEAMRLLYPLIRSRYPALNALLKACGMSKSNFYRAFSGNLTDKTVYDLYWFTQREFPEVPLPVALAELIQLHQLMREEKATLEAASSTPAPAIDMPADHNGGLSRPEDNLPVPHLAGDRQVATMPGWPDLADFLARITSGDATDVVAILRHLGLTSAPADGTAAVAACCSHGLIDEAEAILTYMARRSEPDVMTIAKNLIDAGLPASAKQLLAIALAR